MFWGLSRFTKLNYSNAYDLLVLNIKKLKKFSFTDNLAEVISPHRFRILQQGTCVQQVEAL